MTDNDTWAFGDWWGLLNSELAERGETEASGEEARYYHTSNHSPFAAAHCIGLTRKIARSFRRMITPFTC
jgi:hypothetical protein